MGSSTGCSVAAGWRALKAAHAACGETPLAETAADFQQAVRRDERWREELREVEREDEAQALLDELEARLAAGEQRKALSRGRRLLERYAGTPASARFQRKYPELVDQIREDDGRP